MDRLNLFAIIAILTAVCFLWAGYVQAANVTAQVIKLGASSAAWSGTARVVPMLLKAGNVAKWVVGSLSPASLAIMGAAIIGQYALEHPEQFEKLGAWLNFHAYRINNGAFQVQVTTGGCLTGTPAAAALTEYNNWMQLAYGTGWGGWSTEVLANSAALNARKSQLLAGGAYTQTGAYHPTDGTLYATNTFIKQGCSPGPYCGVIALVYPVNPVHYTETQSWSGTTVAAVTTTWNNDIQNAAPPAVANNLWVDIEKKIEQAQAQEIANPVTSTMMDVPAYGQTGKTIQDVVNEQGRASISSQTITNIENEGDITTNVNGDVTTIINTTNQTIEQAQKEAEGTVTAPAVPGAYTKTYQGVGTRFNTFWQSVRTSAMFNTVNSFFTYNPGGGSCETNISMGNFGTVNYSFCDWAEFLTILRGVFLVAFAFVSIRIVSLKH